MSSRFHNEFSTQSDHFEQARARLSDCVIGHVVLHDRLRGRSINSDVVFPSSPVAPSSKRSTVSSTANSGSSRSNCPSDEEEKAKKLAEKKARRREQLRVSQARFRQKKRDQKLQQEQHVEQELQLLRQSVQGLKLRRQSLKLRGKSKPSRWSIVSEVLHLVDTSFQSPWCIANIEEMKTQADIRRSLAFLQTVLAPRVAMGNLDGFEALKEQLRRYTLYFEDPHLEVQQVEALAPGVMRATGTLSVTITDFSLQFVFPHLAKPEGDSTGKHRLQRERLLNQRLNCNCSMSFLFDEESGCVERLELSIDLLASLRGVCGDLKDASHVLEQALITHDGAIGDLTDKQGSAVGQNF